MTHSTITGRGALAFLTVLLCAACAWAQLPNSRATTFTGQDIAFPQILAGRPAVLVLSFSKKGGAAARQWNEHLGRELGGHPAVAYYNLPVLARVPSLVRRIVVSSIKKSIPERDHGHFAAILDHENDWKTLAGYAAPDEAYVVLIARDGQVAWRAHGAYDDASARELTGKIKALEFPGRK